MHNIYFGLAESVQAHWLGMIDHEWLCPLLKSRETLGQFLSGHGYGPGDAILPCPECGGHHPYVFLREVMGDIPDWKVKHLRRGLNPPRGFAIQPFIKEGNWVISDGRVGLIKEKLFGESPAILEAIFAQLDPPFDTGFCLRFADHEIEDWCYSLEWRRPETRGGNWYFCPELGREELLFQPFHRYFKSVPPQLFFAWERHSRKFPDEFPIIPYELAGEAIFKIEKLERGEIRLKIAFDDGRVLAIRIGHVMPDFSEWHDSSVESRALIAKWYFEAQAGKRPAASEFEVLRARRQSPPNKPEVVWGNASRQ